ncbi:MAG: cyclic nucleotide-binding domain-containing protein [Burkholderiaceae bacterium]|jgi:CRP-like cAMP-binding protein|nr:cyclic nucleotide-binding domain-containing protein [Burkholderiaceae bacterium]MDZ4143170.1 cyclic nucleotide-binding domain-containing protein [Burkholderiales bacterium]PKO42978.1 MAG: cyclic nucleotide-binding domain-containing protein [Betaproteobacteria bacterium HGW-Betaproteobacteria-3]
MLNKLFGRKKTADSDGQFPETCLLDIGQSASAELAATMLADSNALFQLSLAEARTVVRYMQPHRIVEGTTFIQEGDAESTDFMLLVLDGDVTVETIVVSRTQPVTVNVLGPGSLIGEMGLLDGEPRSASCTAATDLRCAILTRSALKKLLADDPKTAAKLLLAISLRIAARMRETADKVKLYAQLTQAMQQEIDALMPT